MACSQRISEVLTAIVAKLVADGDFTDREAFITLEPDKIEIMGGMYCAITPRRIVINDGGVYGGGDEVFLVDMLVNIRVWSENALDEMSRDTDAVTGYLGIYDKLECIIRSLQLYGYCANDGFGFAEPMRLITSEHPARDATRPEWLHLDSTWQVLFLIDYTA